MILGASPDTVAKQAKFKAKYKLPFTLLADKDHVIAEAYGAWQLKKFMGKEYKGVTRSTFVIDPSGKVAHVFPKVSDAGSHPAEVLAVLKELRKTG
jgi:peroxiredoxin Q/BCP